MNQFLLKKGCTELLPFPHITEFASKKNTTIQFDSLPPESSTGLQIFYIDEGRFEWLIDGRPYTLYPGDLALVLPGQVFSGERNFLDIGTLHWMHISVDFSAGSGKLIPGKWSRLSPGESSTIGKIWALSNWAVVGGMKEAGAFFQTVQQELFSQEIGYATRVNQLVDELLILMARQMTRQNNSRRDFPQTFLKLEQTLRESLSHQWTVEEMAALVGLGTTAFSEKVKSFTGFSPLNYLINIRVSEAIKLLKRPDVHVTDIALDVGFYSSQHFATTFKKLTGYTPREFRKKNIPQNQ